MSAAVTAVIAFLAPSLPSCAISWAVLARLQGASSVIRLRQKLGKHDVEARVAESTASIVVSACVHARYDHIALVDYIYTEYYTSYIMYERV